MNSNIEKSNVLKEKELENIQNNIFEINEKEEKIYYKPSLDEYKNNNKQKYWRGFMYCNLIRFIIF